MKRRAVRDLGTLLGVVVVLLAVALANNTMRRSDLAERMVAWRTHAERNREEGGLELLRWDLLRKTKGTFRSGPSFDEELAAKDQQLTDIIGFMVPIETYRAMTEFLLLPMPIECYFCESPPMRDVVLVRMAEGENTDLFEEPVLINGRLHLHEGPETKFFYTLANASIGPGEPDAELTRKTPNTEARSHMMMGNQPEDPLMEGQEPPSASDTE